MNKKFYNVLFRPLLRWRMSAAWMAGAVCFALPAYGQEAQHLSVVAGNESATIEWCELVVTSIEVDGRTIDRPTTPCVITGLTNGRAYRFVLNHPEITSSEPIAGSWVITHDEGYELYYGERDEWADDIPLEEAEETKLTFLPYGRAYLPDIFGLPDRNSAFSWSLNDDNLTIDYEDEDPPMSIRVLSLTSSEMILELFEKETSEDIDRNGDGVINDDDFNYIEFYEKIILRKVSQYTSVYAIPGEPFAPQNVDVVPDDYDAQATVTWTAPLINDAYPTRWMDYRLTVDGQLWENFYHYYIDTDATTATVRNLPTAAGHRRLLTAMASSERAYPKPVTAFSAEALIGVAYNLPTDGQPHPFHLVAVRYLMSEEDGPVVKVVGLSDPVTYTKNEEMITSNIYASDGRLYVQTSEEGTLTIYALNGQQYRQQRINAGATSIPLAGGIYLVTFGGRTTKVYVR